MEEAVIIELIQTACEIFASQAYRQMTQEGLPVGGETDVSYNIYLVGDGYYYYRPYGESASVTEPCTFSLSNAGFSEGNFFVTGNHVQWFLSGEGATIGNVDIQLTSSGEYYIFVRTDGFRLSPIINGGGGSNSWIEISNFGRLMTDSSHTPTYYANQTSGGTYSTDSMQCICTVSDITATSSPTVAQQFPDVVYVPVPSGNEITYNEYRQAVIDWANNQYNFNFDIDISPTWEEIYPTEEPTEDLQPFSIDYNEILGESELESILTQETYYIPELETDFFTTPTEIEFETAGTLGELENIPDFIVDSVKQAWDVIDLWGLSGVFASCATVAVIWALIKNK